jgi:hypothetical protein
VRWHHRGATYPPGTPPGESRICHTLLRTVAEELHEHFEILHATVQLESAGFAQACALRARANPVAAPTASALPRLGAT